MHTPATPTKRYAFGRVVGKRLLRSARAATKSYGGAKHPLPRKRANGLFGFIDLLIRLLYFTYNGGRIRAYIMYIFDIQDESKTTLILFFERSTLFFFF